MKEGQILVRDRWKGWRGIFEYLSLVENARTQLLLIGSKNTGSEYAFLAKYHSVALVVFCRATLDLTAAWLIGCFQLQRDRRNRAVGKPLSSALRKSGRLAVAQKIDDHSGFVKKLDQFRNEWVHRCHGGVHGFADKAPDQPGANLQLAVPIEPDLDPLTMTHDQFAKRVAKCCQRNNGRWIMGVEEFANTFANSTKTVCIDLLETSLTETS